MAFSSACQCFFTLTLFFLIAASPLQTHARESKFFSKVSRSEPEPKPETLNPKTETISPSASPLPEAETKTGYGLFGKEEAYEYAPTTTNPTKSEPGKFKYVQPKETNRGFHYEAGEKQGMSDTRFMENGKYFYDVGQGNGKLCYPDTSNLWSIPYRILGILGHFRTLQKYVSKWSDTLTVSVDQKVGHFDRVLV